MRTPVALAGALCLASFLFVSVRYEDVARKLLSNKPAAGSSTRRTARRMLFRVGKKSGTQSYKQYDSHGDAVKNEDVRYWMRVLQQSSETEPPSSGAGSQTPTVTPITDPPSSNAGTEPPSGSGPPGDGSDGGISSVFFCKWYGTGCNGSSTNWVTSSRTRTNSQTTTSGSSGLTSRDVGGGSQGRWWANLWWAGKAKSTSPAKHVSLSSTIRGSQVSYSSKKYTDFRSVNIRPYTKTWGTRERKLAADVTVDAEPVGSESTYNSGDSRSLDFFIAGFPKCGTTTLLYAFKNHPETAIGDREQCDITSPKFSDDEAFSKLDDTIESLAEADDGVKTAIKCPAGLRNSVGLKRLAKHSPNARILIGLRHPVKYFQSFYNYRITEAHTKGLADEPIPSVDELVGSTEWRGVSTENARFELFLMQLGKTRISVSERKQFIGHQRMAMVPSSFSIFLYSLEQLEDSDEQREASFREDMKEFMHLEQPLQPFRQENMNHFVGEQAFPETINICDADYDHIRGLLVYQGKQTQEWIRTQFLSNPDVTVGNKDHFLQILDTWGTDPCIRDSMMPIDVKAIS